jgi:WD40 repeat protein/serine/threonine protein kinase/tetratricopeptide (TPR) repeat protein
MSESSADRHPVEELAEEFLARKRRGEKPTLAEYTGKYPELAGEIRDLFPALLMMEDLGDNSLGATGPHQPQVVAGPQQVGDYRILREVGHGGMGVVYEAEQISLGRHVALKILPASLANDAKALERFKREARAAARLHHTNIVPVFEVGRDGDTCYYAMQFIQGQGLDQVIAELRKLQQAHDSRRSAVETLPTVDVAAQPAMSRVVRSLLTGNAPPQPSPSSGSSASSDAHAVLPGRMELSGVSGDPRQYYRGVAQVGQQVAAALGYAHARGIVHRDVKPSNLLLDAAGVAWVTDFGLARSETEALTSTGEMVGTVRYTAPERFHGAGDARADIYGLGLTLYEMLVLRPAFDARDWLGMMEQIATREPRRPCSIDPRIPRDLETIVLKAMDKDVARRYPTAQAMADDLRRFLADEPIAARRSSRVERFGRWCRRNPAMAALVAALTVALIAVTGAGIATWYNTRLQTALNDVKEQRREADAQRAQANLLRALADSQRERAEKFEQSVRYARDMNLAHQAWHDAQLGHTRTLLDAWRPSAQGAEDMRGWEWHYLDRLCHHDQRTLQTAVRCDDVAVSSDGRWLAVACNGDDFTVQLWDSRSNQLVHILRGHKQVIQAVAFHPDNRRLASISWDGTTRMWDAESAKEIGLLRGRDWGRSLSFSTDGRWMAGGSGNGDVAVWDAASLQPRWSVKGHHNWVDGVAFSPDGQFLASVGREGTAKLWDMATGEHLRSFWGHRWQAMSVAFSPDGRHLATGGEDETVRLWDVASGQLLASFAGHTGKVCRVAFSPDGRLAASGSYDSTVRLWDVAALRELRVLRGHAHEVRGVAFFPDGRRLASCAWSHDVKIWDLAETPGEKRPSFATESVRAATFSPNGRRLAVGDFGGTVYILDSATLKLLHQFHGHTRAIHQLAFHRGGRQLASAGEDGKLVVWDTVAGKEIRTCKEHFGTFSCVAFHPDGGRLASGHSDGFIRMWDLASGAELRSFRRSNDPIESLAFSPDGAQLVSAGHEVTLWHVAADRELRTFPGRQDNRDCVAFSPDGRMIAVANSDGIVQLLNAGTEHRLIGPFGRVYEAAFHPGGRRLATAGNDRQLRLWDVASGLELLALRNFDHIVYTAAFSPDGQRLAVGGAFTGSLRVLDIGPASPDQTPQRALAWHRREAGACETSANWFAAAFHLSRVIELAPDDPQAFYHRGRSRHQLGRLDDAISDYTEAMNLGMQSYEIHFYRGEAAYNVNRLPLAQADLSRCLELEPGVALFWELRGKIQAQLEQWDKAAADFAKAAELAPDNAFLLYERALAHLGANDADAYRKACAAALASPAALAKPINGHWIAWSCALYPGAVPDFAPAVQQAERAWKARPTEFQYLTTLGAVLYRAGHLEEALKRLNTAKDAYQPTDEVRSSVLYTWLLLAMAHHRQGHAAQARKWLARAIDASDEPVAVPNAQAPAGPVPWNRKLSIRLLRREAEELINGKQISGGK